MFYIVFMPIKLPRPANPEPPADAGSGRKNLLKHQREAVSYLLRKRDQGKGGCLFMEMRLGKTLAFIRFAKVEFDKILVICPLSVCKTWQKELEGDGETSVAIVGGMTPKKRETLLETNPKWVIINYEACIPSQIHQWLPKGAAICIDESLRVANPSAKITKYLLNGKQFPQTAKYLLCGNPAPEGVMQYISQMILADGSLLGRTSYWSLRSTYFRLNGYQWAPNPGVEALFKVAVHDSAFVRTRKECGIGSKKSYMRRFVQMNPAQKKAYASMLSTFEFENVSTDYVTTQLLYLSRIAGGMKPMLPGEFEAGTAPEWLSQSKITEVADMLTGELAGEQTLVWFRFKAEVYMAKEFLAKHCPHLRVGVITGDVKASERDEIREKFLAGQLDTMLMTISTSKVGTDWSSADTEIYYSNEYSSDARSQSEDRIVHPKKTDGLLVIDLVTEGTVDEHVLQLLSEKKIASRMFLSKIWGALGMRKGVANE